MRPNGYGFTIMSGLTRPTAAGHHRWPRKLYFWSMLKKGGLSMQIMGVFKEWSLAETLRWMLAVAYTNELAWQSP